MQTEAGQILLSRCAPLALINEFAETTQLRPSSTPLGCPSPGHAPLPAPEDQPSFWASSGSPLRWGWEASATQLQNMNSKGCVVLLTQG